jgi:polyhydroxybutyrate depolymerase
MLPADPCAPGQQPPTGLQPHSFASDGVERTYFVHAPEGYTSETPWPVIVGLHGIEWRADEWFDATWRAAAAEIEYIVVVPEAIDLNWADRSTDPDVPFVLAVVDDVAQRLCVDTDRVYVSGASDGADMVTRLACAAGDRFAAMRPYIGGFYPELFESEGCDQSNPVPVSTYIGTDEPYYDQALIDEGFAEWASRNGCSTEPVVEEVSDGVTVTRYVDCDADATVEVYLLDSVAHEAAQAECAGNVPGFCITYPFDTTATMTQFFEQHTGG